MEKRRFITAVADIVVPVDIVIIVVVVVVSLTRRDTELEPEL